VEDKPRLGDDHDGEAEDERPGREVIVMLAVFFEAGLAPLSLLLGWILGHPPLERFVWSVQDAVLGVMATVPLVLMFLAMLRWPVGPLSKVKEFCDFEVVPLLGESSWSEIGLVAFSAGVGEEMLFRGVFQPSIGAWLGLPWGVVLAGLLFGLFHPISVTYMIVASILGVYLGLVLYAGGNLFSVIIIHALYDFAALAYVLRIRPVLESEES
jgi:membrane protease YdiL (CAAX protease family)